MYTSHSSGKIMQIFVKFVSIWLFPASILISSTYYFIKKCHLKNKKNSKSVNLKMKPDTSTVWLKIGRSQCQMFDLKDKVTFLGVAVSKLKGKTKNEK